MTVLIAGASGLVGGLALRRLLGGSSDVVAVARRPLADSDTRLRVIISELDRLGQLPPVPASVALCALGTTMAKARSREAFRRVDHDGVVDFARWARQGGVGTFVMVSSVGASPRARTFYLRVKGETEEAVAALGFSRLVFLRPSLLLGPRADRRPAERFFAAVIPPLGALLGGPLRRYRAMAAADVASAMIAAAAATEPGRFVWHHDEIAAAAKAP